MNPSSGHDRQISAETYRRNQAYLQLIFNHHAHVINDVLDSKEGNYALAYDALVRREGHGTPGAAHRGAASVPRIAPLTVTRRHSKESSRRDREESRIRRAENLIKSFENRESSSREFWEKLWQDDYRGFREAQKEIGVLRDDIVKGKFREDMSRHTLEYLRNKLNFMLQSSVSEWYKKWGELDLHRLSSRDALELVRNHLRQPPWHEMRIVAGQRPHHGDDHNSEGVLYHLIHCMFDKTFSDQTHHYATEQVSMIRDIQRFARENNIQYFFYSNEAAVYLIKPRRLRPSQPPPGFPRRKSRIRQSSERLEKR